MEIKRLRNEFSNLYNGDPWLDVTLKQTLQGISAEKAAQRIARDRNSIWEILNHLIEWRRMLLKRMSGNIIAVPEDNFIREVPDTSEVSWRHTLAELEETQQDWLSFLDGLQDEDLEKTYSGNGQSYYYLIQGTIQHDAYHLGQIVLLSKLEY
ncbi:DinB family protein [Salinimicrobium oceani]|uniref:DinB family protein n=1 Tax=Salinimicrobium oceani TaxID=2722702 RepID=A0ABX1CY84_9FLAO|nr:DinB family protein [Salinimicrobium oceani]NJW51296.1 DinB family protein [Salinimicrobium oceani]